MKQGVKESKQNLERYIIIIDAIDQKIVSHQTNKNIFLKIHTDIHIHKIEKADRKMEQEINDN